MLQSRMSRIHWIYSKFLFFRGVPLGISPSGHEELRSTYKIGDVEYTAIRSIPVWPIRAKHGDDLIPGKLVGDPVQAYISWSGREIQVTQFEVSFYLKNYLKFTNYLKVFVNGNVKWVEASNGVNPPKAVVGGGNAIEILYIGRAFYQGSIITGKVQPKHYGMYIPIAGREIFFKDYEVLVYN